MKKLFLLLTFFGLLATACESGGGVEEENGGNAPTLKIELSKQTVDVDFETGTYSISVTSPYSWRASSDNDWIVVNSKTGIAGTKELKFSVKRNEEEEIREGTIVIKNEDYNLIAELYVVQKSFTPSIIVEPETISFTAEGGTQNIAIIANFEYEVNTSAKWLSCTKNENGITVTVPNYVEIEERTAEITISSDKYDISKIIEVTQAGTKCCIVYTSSDGKVVNPYKTNVFGANIVSNTYENGKGIIKFDAPVTSIGELAFFHLDSLTSVIIPNSVTSIGWRAFEYCSSLTRVTIPNSVTSIGDSAFLYCSSLTCITIPDSVTSIGNYAFQNCSSLTSVTISDSVTSIGDYAFYGCSSLTAFYGKYASADNRCLIIDGVLSAFAPVDLTQYTIPEGVTSIGNYAFYGCSSLTSITIPSSVTSIGSYAFAICSSLTSITIPDSVTSIGSYAFAICSSLTSITIPDSVTSIGDYTFYDCSSLTSITIPSSVTSIGSYAFIGCSSLTSVTIGNGVTSIEDSAFASCDSLTNITIPDSVTSIGDSAFNFCSSLTSVTIGNSVTSIGGSAFDFCISLTSVYCKPTTPPAGSSNMFYGNASGRKIYVPTGSVNKYKSAEYWSDYASDIVGYDF